jgi:hypothetical protein
MVDDPEPNARQRPDGVKEIQAEQVTADPKGVLADKPPTSALDLTVTEASVPLRAFLATVSALNEAERSIIVEQAVLLLESFYAHLPLKCAMHAVDPLQRLRLLLRRLAQYDNDLAFHAEMTDIFTSLRDLHTNYLLPSPFRNVVATLPFRVEECYNGTSRSYIVAGVANGFSHETFVPGVEITYWSGIPIFRAVEISESDPKSNRNDPGHDKVA